jgi:hypothetical protein
LTLDERGTAIRRKIRGGMLSCKRVWLSHSSGQSLTIPRLSGTYVVFERELGVTSNMVSQLSFPRSREAQLLPQTLGLSSHLNFIRLAISRINNHLDSSMMYGYDGSVIEGFDLAHLQGIGCLAVPWCVLKALSIQTILVPSFCYFVSFFSIVL